MDLCVLDDANNPNQWQKHVLWLYLGCCMWQVLTWVIINSHIRDEIVSQDER